LISLLDSQEWDRVVFAGDLFDLWVSSYKEVRERHWRLLEVIRGLPCEVVYVPGNHDEAFGGLGELNGMLVEDQPYQFMDQKRVAIFHGDTFDPVENLGLLPRALYSMGAVLDRAVQCLGGKGFSIQRALRYSLAGSGAGEEYSRAVAEGAVSAVEADVVIAGHTHFPLGPEEIEGATYVNSGDFGPEHMTWVVLEDGVPKVSWA